MSRTPRCVSLGGGEGGGEGGGPPFLPPPPTFGVVAGVELEELGGVVGEGEDVETSLQHHHQPGGGGQVATWVPCRVLGYPPVPLIEKILGGG